MYKSVLGLLFFFTMGATLAQNNAETTPKKWQFKEVSLSMGTLMANSKFLSLEEMRQLFPGSQLLQEDFSGFDDPINYHFVNSGPVVAINAGLEGFRSRHRLRLGILLSPGVSGGLYLSREERSRYDTTYNDLGESIFLDSVSHYGMASGYSSQSFRLDVAYTLSAPAGERWQFYSGLGVGVGFNFINTVHATRHQRAGVEPANPVHRTGVSQFDQLDDINESEELPLNVSLAAYVPLGVSFAVFKKEAQKQRVHIFTEFRPQIAVNDVPRLGTLTTYQVQADLGLRWQL